MLKRLKLLLITIFILTSILIAGCTMYKPPIEFTKSEFKSDGCSMFPDNWHYECCYKHDQSYWDGGNPKDRLHADNIFKQCVADISGSFVANTMYFSVRIGGHPILPLPWRWDFGIPYQKGYK